MDLAGKHILLVGFRGKASHIKSAQAAGATFDLIIDKRDFKPQYEEHFQQVTVLDDIFDWHQLEPALAKAQYHGVYTRFEDFTTVVAAIAKHLNLPQVQFSDAPKFRNKYLMRQAFAQHQVPSAEFCLVTKPADATEFVAKHQFPLIVKQIAGIHSKYVAKVKNQAELEQTITFFLECLSQETGTLHGQLKNYPEAITAPDHHTHLLVEEFITGQELTVDAFVVDGAVFLTPITKYVMPEEMGITDHHLPIRIMPYNLPAADQEIVNQAVKAALKALGANYCVTHAEVFFNPTTHDCRLIEVASRGGGFRAEMVQATCGSDYDLGVARAALGLPPNVPCTPTSHCAVVEVFAPKNGHLKSVNYNLLEGQPDVSHITHNRQPGEEVGLASDGKSFVLKFMVTGESYDEVESRAKELLMAMRESVEVDG